MARQIANFGRLVDSVFFTTVALFISGFGLFLLGELYKNVVQQEAKKLSKVAGVVARLFPFPDKKFEFSLTHVVVFSMLIGLLCMLHHPAQDILQHDAEREQKERKRREEVEKRKRKEEKKAQGDK
ncbi:unnamed protein product [Symbiodinium necroappetens]|uniref:Uncharacterized protein n=1 Tax=Symbiodinium necroappetens TaxID=1628268 RepID=A0A812QWW5_9DINO|nr:unnamed protein product [Symbiodinium necroappetens]CAE7546056.1 unnamed protein product [Symbiodinium sp. KB8]CAE7685164.1 unnamed protein product [Symbiodinium microadriaticum]|eukprot:CAMPEP_0181486836 /NCGR_PEP_ID=MMETSP1110-20121109/47448_1 /TAXON_ID=174948 /ORGANISM="Symbiodinium sp., Strain CCMP421" /LENGTH=125 /DNA_ID=CAMNT_0023613203 /DNA_START=63 /DNA_END=440 /DNA_ORIENTATION=-